MLAKLGGAIGIAAGSADMLEISNGRAMPIFQRRSHIYIGYKIPINPYHEHYLLPPRLNLALQ